MAKILIFNFLGGVGGEKIVLGRVGGGNRNAAANFDHRHMLRQMNFREKHRWKLM